MPSHSATGRPTLLRRATSDLTSATPVSLVPLPLTGRDLSERQLQDLLHAQPDVLPIDAISSRWGPLVSLGCEIEVEAGFIDNLFVSPHGELTVVEAKLWRNPEARREVVGQIIHYAASLSRMTYGALDQAVRTSTAGLPIWAQVQASLHASSADREAEFVDTVARNLSSGRFLLLVVGDGIRSDIHDIAELLARHPTLAFHLELVELRVYSVPDTTDLVVVPSLVGRSEEVTRAVVEIRNPGGAEVSVAVELAEPTPDGSDRLRSLDDFMMRAAEAVGEARAAALVGVAEWWRDHMGGQVRLNKSSYSLYARAGSTSVSALTVYTTGEAVGSVAPVAKTHALAEPDQTVARYQAAGFSGAADYPQLVFDPTIEEQRIQVEELLAWVAATAADIETK
jgi:hypothetical protein